MVALDSKAIQIGYKQSFWNNHSMRGTLLTSCSNIVISTTLFVPCRMWVGKVLNIMHCNLRLSVNAVPTNKSAWGEDRVHPKSYLLYVALQAICIYQGPALNFLRNVNVAVECLLTDCINKNLWFRPAKPDLYLPRIPLPIVHRPPVITFGVQCFPIIPFDNVILFTCHQKLKLSTTSPPSSRSWSPTFSQRCRVKSFYSFIQLVILKIYTMSICRHL